MDGGRHERKDVSRAALTAHSKTRFCAYARASLRLRTSTTLKRTEMSMTCRLGTPFQDDLLSRAQRGMTGRLPARTRLGLDGASLRYSIT